MTLTDVKGGRDVVENGCRVISEKYDAGILCMWLGTSVGWVTVDGLAATNLLPLDRPLFFLAGVPGGEVGGGVYTGGGGVYTGDVCGPHW